MKSQNDLKNEWLRKYWWVMFLIGFSFGVIIVLMS